MNFNAKDYFLLSGISLIIYYSFWTVIDVEIRNSLFVDFDYPWKLVLIDLGTCLLLTFLSLMISNGVMKLVKFDGFRKSGMLIHAVFLLVINLIIAQLLSRCLYYYFDGASSRIIDTFVFGLIATFISYYHTSSCLWTDRIRLIEEEELLKAQNAAAVKKLLESDGVASGIDTLIDMIQKQGSPAYRKRILLNRSDFSEVVSVENVSHFYTDCGITKVFTAGGQWAAIDQSLEELQKQLDPSVFFRANRQYIVNIKNVKRIHQWFKGKTHLQLDTFPDVNIEISREKSTELKRWLDR